MPIELFAPFTDSCVAVVKEVVQKMLVKTSVVPWFWSLVAVRPKLMVMLWKKNMLGRSFVCISCISYYGMLRVKLVLAWDEPGHCICFVFS